MGAAIDDRPQRPGNLKPVIDRRYPLSEVVETLRHVDVGHARGKVVLSM